MNANSHKNRSFASLVLVMVLVSCGSATSPNKMRWLNKEPCEFPCWEGIEPGKDTVRQAIDKLNKLDVVSEIEHSFRAYNRGGSGDGQVSWKWRDESGFQLTLKRTFVYLNTIEFTLGYTETLNNIRLQFSGGVLFSDLRKAYGDPDYVYVTRPGRDASFIIKFGYLQHGFYVKHDFTNKEVSLSSELPQDFQFQELNIFSPNTYEGLHTALSPRTKIVLLKWKDRSSYMDYCKQVSSEYCSPDLSIHLLPTLSPDQTPIP